MNKQELVNALTEKTGMSKTTAANTVDVVFDIIAESLGKGEEVRLVNFGTFSISNRAASQGIDPRTRKVIQIEASKRVKFKTGKGLKDLINDVKSSKTTPAKATKAKRAE